jgi:regulator of RNase E activity RraB
MATDFNFYLCNVNDKLSSIYVDLALRRDAPDPYRNRLLWVWVEMNFPRSDGLSDGPEAPKLYQIEDELTSALALSDAVFAGRITGDNRREFYYYLPASKNPKDTVLGAMKAHPDYKFTFGSKADPDWSQYLGLLYPSDEVRQAMANRDTLQAIREKGDSLDVSREVNHWVYFNSDEERKSFAQAADALGYTLQSGSHFEQPKGGFRFGLRLCKTQPIDQDAIDKTTLELFRLSKQFNADYDGWESQVIAEDPSQKLPRSIH